MGNITKDLGAVSAYALAVEKGYTGTEEEFAVLLATSAQNAQSAAESAAAAKKSEEAAARSEENVHDYITDINNAGSAQVSAVNAAGAAQQSAIEQKGAATLETIPADYTALAQDVSALKDTKADCITDTSAKAARHTLHAQRGPMGVTLFGKTTETGTGDKSPDNPYEIGGVDAARVHCGGKNLFNMPEVSDTRNGVTYSADGNGAITYLGLSGGTAGNVFMLDIPNPITIQPGMKIVIDATNAPNPHGLNFRNTVTGDNRTLNSSPGKVIAFNVGASHAGQTFNHVRDWISLEIEYNDTLKIMFTYSDDNEFEPYTANVITPPLLPDGAPLMGNGTVDDTVENDVLSGCDVAITFDGSDDELWTLASSGPWAYTQKDIPNPANNMTSLVGHCYADKLLAVDLQTVISGKQDGIAAAMQSSALRRVAVSFAGVTTLEGIKARLATNPLTVFYRSTDYTPDKDLRVCRTVRKWHEETVDTSEGMAVVFDVIGDCCRASFKVSKSNADNKVGIGDILPYKFNYEEDSEHAYVGSNGYAYIFVKTSRLATVDYQGINAWVKTNMPKFWYPLATPETYMTDPLPLRKPDTLTTETTTVTGSGETAVEYPHDTKHYIDSKVSELVTLALANQ